MNTRLVPLPHIENAVDDGIHAGIGTREDEECSLNTSIDIMG